MECLRCSGAGCDACNQTGYFQLAACPREFVDREMWEVLGFADLYAKGLPPVIGGSLDQARWFVNACRMIWSEQNYWKAKLMKLDE